MSDESAFNPWITHPYQPAEFLKVQILGSRIPDFIKEKFQHFFFGLSLGGLESNYINKLRPRKHNNILLFNCHNLMPFFLLLKYTHINLKA